MNRNDVKESQAKKISQALYPGTNHLVRLRRPMEQLGFLPDDPFFLLVCAAYDAMHRLGVHVHYLSCDGTGKQGPRRIHPRLAPDRRGGSVCE
jgi:hypothetical protein